MFSTLVAFAFIGALQIIDWLIYIYIFYDIIYFKELHFELNKLLALVSN